MNYFESEQHKQAMKNLEEWRKIEEFIQTLDDEGIDTFINDAKITGHTIENEDEFRRTLIRIRDKVK